MCMQKCGGEWEVFDHLGSDRLGESIGDRCHRERGLLVVLVREIVLRLQEKKQDR